MVEQMTTHDALAVEARRTGDPTLIRELYASYGEALHGAFAGRELDVSQHGSQLVAEWQGRNLPALAPNGQVLDVGCGPRPEASIRVAKSGRIVVCSDVSFGVAAVARGVAHKEGAPGIHFVVADAEALPFRTGAFGLIIADDVIEHVPEPARLTAECARVVDEGGLVSISTPNRRAVSVFVDRMKDLARGNWGPREKYFLVTSHLREYTRRELRTLGRAYFRGVGFAWTGWDGESAAKRLATRVTGWRAFRGLSRHWIVLLRGPLRAGGGRST
jgi:SAM-dependent methyltransferase